MIQAYVDGAHRNGKVTWAYILVEDGKEIARASGQVVEPQALVSNNVAGELGSVMRAIDKAEILGYSELEIVHDYTGPAEWANGTWATKKWVSKEYKAFLSRHLIPIRFLKVKAHSGNIWNEMADKLAGEELAKLDAALDVSAR
jgi:ribonuclease HI